MDKDRGQYTKDTSVEKISFESWPISLLEFVMYNSFLSKCLSKRIEEFKVSSYGEIKRINNVRFGGDLSHTSPWWFMVEHKKKVFILQTHVFVSSSGRLCSELQISLQTPDSFKAIGLISDLLHKAAFKHSDYTGKCLDVRIHNGSFERIKIVPTNTKEFDVNLELSKTQKRFLQHFIRRVRKGKKVRYMLNGEPGTGKSETMRMIIKELESEVTFIMPDFKSSDDLIAILEASEVFEKCVVILDDIHMHLSSREKDGPSKLLADFLKYFDGIPKRNVSVLAATNSKDLIDKAAERPGRFNMIIDYTHLENDQIDRVVDMYIPKKFRRPSIYEAFKSNDKSGKKMKITGAFISNLAENLEEMANDDEEWTEDDTITLIKESYAGFYSSQTSKNEPLGFHSR